ncbi:MAG TPA: DUF4383 domain-containing protein [Verrucomicrobiae bacterium]|nr:DUF4383 domain-containing protein [Verrucomicrobiae bacterium]
MNAPLIARILGFVFLVFGVAGFVPWIAPAAPFDAPVVTLDVAYRVLFGLFALNVAHDVLHLFFGIWGVVASLRFKSAVLYLRIVTWVYLIVVLLGVIPITNTLFGVAPIYGWDVALHLIVVLLAAYGGYGRGAIVPEAQAPAA